MTRRSVNNERYRNIESSESKKSTGKKSASQAKPVKEAASTVYEKPKAKLTRKEQKALAAEQERKRKARVEKKYSEIESTTLALDISKQNEIKKWRRIWWVFLGLGVVLVFASWFAKDISGIAFIISIVLAYAMIAGALYIEFGKINKIRKKMDREGDVGKVTKKQVKHKLEAQKLEDARRAAKQKKSPFKAKLKKEQPSVTNYPMDESSEH